MVQNIVIKNWPLVKKLALNENVHHIFKERCRFYRRFRE